jgi:AraC-like DNA-binding protein
MTSGYRTRPKCQWINPAKTCTILISMDTRLIIVEGGHTRCDPTTWRHRDDRNNIAKLYALESGSAWIEVDDTRAKLRANGLYLIPPHKHLHYGTRTGMTVNWLHFMPLSPMLDARLATLKSVCALPSDLATRWRPVTDMLADYFTDRTTARECRVQALALDAVGSALDAAPPLNLAIERLLPALRYMDDHVTVMPSLAEIARTVHVSPEHFHRLFRARFHTTPFEYLLGRRLALARTLLTEGKLSVKEVAVACGYDDPYYFSRLFRQRHGYPPRAVQAGKTPAMP